MVDYYGVLRLEFLSTASTPFISNSYNFFFTKRGIRSTGLLCKKWVSGIRLMFSRVNKDLQSSCDMLWYHRSSKWLSVGDGVCMFVTVLLKCIGLAYACGFVFFNDSQCFSSETLYFLSSTRNALTRSWCHRISLVKRFHTVNGTCTFCRVDGMCILWRFAIRQVVYTEHAHSVDLIVVFSWTGSPSFCVSNCYVPFNCNNCLIKGKILRSMRIHFPRVVFVWSPSEECWKWPYNNWIYMYVLPTFHMILSVRTLKISRRSCDLAWVPTSYTWHWGCCLCRFLIVHWRVQKGHMSPKRRLFVHA